MDSHLFDGHKMGLEIKWINNNSINSPLMSIDMDWKLVGTIQWINEANNYIQSWSFLSSHSASLQICYCVSKLSKLDQVGLPASDHASRLTPLIAHRDRNSSLNAPCSPFREQLDRDDWGWVTTLKNGQCQWNFCGSGKSFLFRWVSMVFP